MSETNIPNCYCCAKPISDQCKCLLQCKCELCWFCTMHCTCTFEMRVEHNEALDRYVEEKEAIRQKYPENVNRRK